MPLLEDKAQGGQMLRTAFPMVRVAAVVFEEREKEFLPLLRAPQVSSKTTAATLTIGNAGIPTIAESAPGLKWALLFTWMFVRL